jgi:hypothetical protein
LKKQTFELRKEELQIKKVRVQAATTAQKAPEPSPGAQEMAA